MEKQTFNQTNEDKILSYNVLIMKIIRENMERHYRNGKTDGKFWFYPKLDEKAIETIEEDEEKYKKGLIRLLKNIIKHWQKLIKNIETKRTINTQGKLETNKMKLDLFLTRKINKLNTKYKMKGTIKILYNSILNKKYL